MLNHGSSSCLHSTLATLSDLTFFPQILIRCLRKQERTTWPRAVHNVYDLLFIFRSFLNAGDLEFASTSISILQGVACSASEICIHQDTSDSLYRWCNFAAISRQALPSLRFLLTPFSYLWVEESMSPRDSEECVAHKSGIELLLVRILRGEVSSLSDIYRFVVMEEQRHLEDGDCLPLQFHVNHVLTYVMQLLLSRGMLDLFAELQYEVGEVWESDLSVFNGCSVHNFDEILHAFFHRSQLVLPPLEVFEDPDLRKELHAKCGVRFVV